MRNDETSINGKSFLTQSILSVCFYLIYLERGLMREENIEDILQKEIHTLFVEQQLDW